MPPGIFAGLDPYALVLEVILMCLPTCQAWFHEHSHQVTWRRLVRQCEGRQSVGCYWESLSPKQHMPVTGKAQGEERNNGTSPPEITKN